jgi:hypothetical protein
MLENIWENFFQDAVKPFGQIWKCYTRDYTNAGGKKNHCCPSSFLGTLENPDARKLLAF